MHTFDALSGVPGQDNFEQIAHPQNFAGSDFEIGNLPVANLAIRLVQQNAGVRQRETLALGAGSQQNRRCRGCLAQANGGDVVFDELHRVVDGKQGGDVATGAVDVDVDVFVWVFALQVDELRANQVGDRVVDWRAKKDDVVFQHPAVEVIHPLTTAGGLGDVGNVIVRKVHISLIHRGYLSPYSSPLRSCWIQRQESRMHQYRALHQYPRPHQATSRCQWRGPRGPHR